jgi:predicted dehydrogenase
VNPTIGIGVIGFGWMGQAHSRSYLRIPTLFPERRFEPSLVICADSVAGRRDDAIRSFGFVDATDDWRKVVEHPGVQIVVVTAPNMLHEQLCVAAAEAGKHLFCEKPVGGTPEQTLRIAAAVRRAEVISGVGYNYRWVPLVLHARELIADGRLGELTNYRGRFFTMYGSDPLGILSWRFLQDEGGYGVSSDILSHAVDLATMLIGPITKVAGTRETFIRQRPLPQVGGASHYARGALGDPTGDVTNEDYAAALVVFANGARGTFESSRSMIGPESQMAFEVYGTKGSIAWNLEQLNELQVYLVDDDGRAPRGYTTVYGGDRYPFHGHFVPGDANSIGFEDVITIEDYAFLTSVAAGQQHEPGLEEAVDYVSFQAAWLRSCASGRWENVVRLEGGSRPGDIRRGDA